MLAFYYSLFGVLIVICALLQYFARKKPNIPAAADSTVQVEQPVTSEDSKPFLSFQRNYLLVYFIVMEADWLQGPYVYALYRAYNFAKEDIAILFIAGFTSSMIFGTFVGSIADKYGRKNMCMAFGIIYSLSCLTKLVPDFTILFIGRLLAGVATSLLFSSFESWMVFEHFKLGFSQKSLSDTFSLATFGNGIVAILAGLLASFVANYSFVGPFMVAMAFLILATIIVYFTWTENYGDASIDITNTFTNGWRALKSDTKILLLGSIQSLFEGSMYVFVFMWTPALTEHEDETSADFKGDDAGFLYGLIFACFMVCIMIGSSIFSILTHAGYKLEVIAMGLLVTASVALCLPAIFVDSTIILFGFLLFEVCCGLYFPCLGTLRGKYIPEDTRATIMNFFRVPLNFLVVVILLKVSMFQNQTVFLITTAWLLLALCLAKWFGSLTAPLEKGAKGILPSS